MNKPVLARFIAVVEIADRQPISIETYRLAASRAFPAKLQAC